ncbi:MAG TPA: disulfide bond formation protein B [Usitatibacteraceae bacterium]|nr:disulfide bond formation protein B [Usitatibacteraceae bacterium]
MAAMLAPFLERLTPRQVFAAIFAACAGLIGFGLTLQHFVGLEPCPMCILQRYAFVSIGVVALIAALHGPVGAGVKVYGLLVAGLAVAGGSVSVRQSLLQRFPKPEVASNCGADLDFLLGNFPLAQALPKIFAGTGDCAKVEWSLFGLSIAEWALVWFALLLAASLWVAFLRRRPAIA